MPIGQLGNPQGAFGEPIGGTGVANNSLTYAWAFNNSGAAMQPGDIVSWDQNTALSAATNTISGAQDLVTGANSYAVTSSSAFGTAGPIVAIGVTPTGAGNTGVKQNLFGIISAKADGTHVTVAFRVSATTTLGLPDGTVLFVPPNGTLVSPAGQVAIPGTTGGAVPAVTYPIIAKDCLIAGVVLPPSLDTATWATNTLYAPGAIVPVCTAGLARVYIGGATVAALAPISSTATLNADDNTPTIGNLVGCTIESQANKDVNQTVRCIVKVG